MRTVWPLSEGLLLLQSPPWLGLASSLGLHLPASLTMQILELQPHPAPGSAMGEKWWWRSAGGSSDGNRWWNAGQSKGHKWGMDRHIGRAETEAVWTGQENMTMGLWISCKCESVAKHPNFDPMTVGNDTIASIPRGSHNYYPFSNIVNLNSCGMNAYNSKTICKNFI